MLYENTNPSFFSHQTLVPPCPEVSGLPGEKFSLDLVGSSRKGGSSIYLYSNLPYNEYRNIYAF